MANAERRNTGIHLPKTNRKKEKLYLILLYKYTSFNKANIFSWVIQFKSLKLNKSFLHCAPDRFHIYACNPFIPYCLY